MNQINSKKSYLIGIIIGVILFSCTINGFLVYNFLSQNILTPDPKSEHDILRPFVSNSTSNTTANEEYVGNTLFDSIELFIPPTMEKTLNFTFQKDWVYYFSFESYVPFDTSFEIDLYCKSPETIYHFYHYSAALERNVTKIDVEYGAAETGNHNITFSVKTTEPINLHLVVNETASMKDYYRWEALDAPPEYYFGSIDKFNVLNLTRNYSIPMIDDTVYEFNLFRVNPISSQDIAASNYTNPTVNMKLILNGTEFRFYPDVQAITYALKSNKVSNFGYLENVNYTTTFSSSMRFGAHISNTTSVQIVFDNISTGFDLNFGFVCYKQGVAGDGPDNITLSNETSSFFPDGPDNQTELLDNFGENTTSTFDEIVATVEEFVDEYYDIILIVLATSLGAAMGINYYTRHKKGRTVASDENREEDSSLSGKLARNSVANDFKTPRKAAASRSNRHSNRRSKSRTNSNSNRSIGRYD
jgi:hypothetical protein